MCRPKMAGSGPSTGRMRTRKSRSGASSSTAPLASSVSGSGSSVTSLGTSVEYTTGMAYSHAVVELGEGGSTSTSAGVKAVEGSEGVVEGAAREDQERVARRR